MQSFKKFFRLHHTVWCGPWLLGISLFLIAADFAFGGSIGSNVQVMTSDDWRAKIFGPNEEHLNEESFETSTITTDEAEQLFILLAQDPAINFDAPFDGCYARATRMAMIAESRGIIMGKVFSVGRLQTVIRYLDKDRLLRWSFHVAPVVKVRSSDGLSMMMVFDPSLFSKPKTVIEWNEKLLRPAPPHLVESETDLMPPKIELTFFTRRFQHKPGLSGARQWSDNDLEETMSTLQFWSQLKQPSIILPVTSPVRPEL